MIKRSLLLVTVVLLVWPATAWAHPAYKASDPPANSSVAQAPSELWVEFTERVEDGTVSVYDPCGTQVDNGDSQRNLTNDRITVTMSASRSGTYRVVWKVLGSDGHPTNGEFNFTSTGGDPCPGQEEDPDDPKPDPDPKPRDNSTSEDDGDDTSGAVGPKSGGRTDRHPDGHKDPKSNDTKKDAGVRADRETSDEGDEATEVVAAPTSSTSIWDDLPLGDFAVALGVAALIGAAGGRIYAGIIGPR